LIGSFSRTGWSMLVVGLIGLGWKRHKKLLVASAAIAVVLSVVVPSVRERVYSSTGSSANGTGTSRFVPSSYQWRIDTWHALLLKYRERPLIGFGLRSTPFVNPRQLHFGGQVTGYDAHNSVVKLLIEGGPALVAGWAIFFAIVLTKAVRMARARWAFQPAARIVLGLWAVVAFIGLTADDLLAATALMLVVMALTGAVEGAWRRENLQPGPS
jgi:O-antigen ligase